MSIDAATIIEERFYDENHEKSSVVYEHAAYVRYVLNSFMYEQQDVLEKFHDVKGLNFSHMMFAEAGYAGINSEDEFSPYYTEWTIEVSGYADEDLHFIVKKDMGGLPVALFDKVSEETSRAVNRMAQERFKEGYRKEIALAQEVVKNSDTNVIRERLREHHDKIAQALGYRDSGRSPLYSYRGNLPMGENWGFTDVSTHYGDHPVNKDQYYQAVNEIKKSAGDEDIENMWQIVRVDSWGYKWIDRVAMQCYFSSKHPWFLTPVFINYYNDVYDQWQEWDTSEDYEDEN